MGLNKSFRLAYLSALQLKILQAPNLEISTDCPLDSKTEFLLCSNLCFVPIEMTRPERLVQWVKGQLINSVYGL